MIFAYKERDFGKVTETILFLKESIPYPGLVLVAIISYELLQFLF